MPWDDPSDASFFQMKDHVGALCLIAVNEYVPSYPTRMGTGPVVRTEIVVIDGPGAGGRYPDAIIFQKVLVAQLKASLGSVILARVVHGQAKVGQSPPYQLAKAGPGDAELANTWVKAHGDIEAHPVDTSMASPQGYAPDGGTEWRGGQGQAPTQQQQYQLPPPPSYPGTYTQPAGVGPQASGPDDEAPF